MYPLRVVFKYTGKGPRNWNVQPRLVGGGARGREVTCHKKRSTVLYEPKFGPPHPSSIKNSWICPCLRTNSENNNNNCNGNDNTKNDDNDNDNNNISKLKGLSRGYCRLSSSSFVLESLLIVLNVTRVTLVSVQVNNCWFSDCLSNRIG